MSRTVALIVGGLAAVGTAVAAVFVSREAKKTESGVQHAVDGDGAPSVKVRLTHYYPWAAVTAKEKLMEGGVKDRKGQPLRTVEDFLSGKSDHVSMAGDWTLWPYGQKILVPWGDKTLVGRVTDTGGHFFGSKKLVRATGYEPIDVCVFDKNNRPPKSLVSAQVVVGDHLDKNKQKQPQLVKMGIPVAAVGSGFDMLGAEVA